jgi:hypothetical protein
MEECNAKHRIVNGEGIATYRMNVYQSYQEAKREYMEIYKSYKSYQGTLLS